MTSSQSIKQFTATGSNTGTTAAISTITIATASSTSFRNSVSTSNAATTALITTPKFIEFAAASDRDQLSPDNIIILVVSGGVLFCVLSVIVFITCVCRKKDKRKGERDSLSQDSTPGLTIYTDPSQLVRTNLPIDDYNNSPMRVPPVVDKTTHIIQVSEEYDDTPYPPSIDNTNDYDSEEETGYEK